MPEEGSSTPLDVIRSFFGARAAGDRAAARKCWLDTAVFHTTGSHRWAADYDADGYLDGLDRWYSTYPGYFARATGMLSQGEDVAEVTIESEHGEAPGIASGLLLFRVVGNRIVEGWAIPTFSSGKFPF